jgi:hypothetical protein
MSKKEWDEDPWDHTPPARDAMAQFVQKGKYSKSYQPAGYQISTVNAALRQAIRDIVREEIDKSLNVVFQTLMDRLDDLEEALRGR